MLDKNPESRITIGQIKVFAGAELTYLLDVFSKSYYSTTQDHPFLTRRGKDPLPTTEDNVASKNSDVTEEELQHALTPFSQMMVGDRSIGAASSVFGLSKC